MKKRLYPDFDQILSGKNQDKFGFITGRGDHRNDRGGGGPGGMNRNNTNAPSPPVRGGSDSNRGSNRGPGMPGPNAGGRDHGGSRRGGDDRNSNRDRSGGNDRADNSHAGEYYYELKFPELSRAELGHFNFRAETEIDIF